MSAMIRFSYRSADGALSKRELSNWSEEGHYIHGFDITAGDVRTFRKDRIVEYFDGAAAFLASPIEAGPPRLRAAAPKDTRPQILFTGFPAVQRAHLESLSDTAGLRVVTKVTKGLAFLCIGPTAGPSKVAKSRQQGVYIVREPELHALLETGELPDYALSDLC